MRLAWPVAVVVSAGMLSHGMVRIAEAVEAASKVPDRVLSGTQPDLADKMARAGSLKEVKRIYKEGMR